MIQSKTLLSSTQNISVFWLMPNSNECNEYRTYLFQIKITVLVFYSYFEKLIRIKVLGLKKLLKMS